MSAFLWSWAALLDWLWVRDAHAGRTVGSLWFLSKLTRWNTGTRFHPTPGPSRKREGWRFHATPGPSRKREGWRFYPTPGPSRKREGWRFRPGPSRKREG